MRISAPFKPSSRCVRLLLIGFFGVALAGCGNDVTRFNDNPTGNPFHSQSSNGAPNSTAPRQYSSAPAQIESRPLGQPAYNSGGTPVYGPRAYGQNSAPAAQPSYRPQPSYQPQQASYQPRYSPAPRSVPAAPAPVYSPSNDTTGAIGARSSHRVTVRLRRGETLYSLARRYGVTVSALMRENNLSDAAHIRAGQRIVIPGHGQPTRSASAHSRSGNVHVVARHETLTGIARHYHISRKQLAHANRMDEYASLRVGQRLSVPGTAVASNSRPHHAQARAETRTETPPRKQAAREPVQAPVDHVASVKPVNTIPVTKTAARDSAPNFRWPVKGRVISGFGSKPNGQQNDGINISVPENTAVKAAEDGVVAYAGNELKGYGNLVLLRHPGGWVTAYAHNSEILVHRGETVKRGQVIAKAGQTGGVASPQVHFEIRKGSNPVDPVRHLSSL